MSNPYSSQTISGYNSSPPTDDGAQTTANQITWAKHKTKLADPIKALSEGIDSAVSTAFGKIFLNDAVSKSSAYTVTSSDQGKLFNVTNTTTITLPASGSVGPNFVVAVRNNGSGVVTIDGNSSETINGSVTMALNPGFSAVLMADGNGWFAYSGLPDGMNATLSELNELDASAAAVSNFVHGVRTYIYAGSSEQTIDAAAVLASGAFESFGPTGSGATNIWSAMDVLPAGCAAVILSVFHSVTASSSSAQTVGLTGARQTGSSSTLTTEYITYIEFYSTTAVATETQTDFQRDVIIPLDSSNRFDFRYFDATNVGNRSVDLYLRGFIK